MRQIFFYMFTTSTLFWSSSLSAEEMIGGVKEGFFTCDEMKNITILLNSYGKFTTQYQEHNQHMIQSISILVKALLDTPCVLVWFYSSILARSIRQQMHNYDQFLSTEIQSITTTPDTSLHVHFLHDFSMMVGREKQMLLVIDRFFWAPLNYHYYIVSSPLLKQIDDVPNMRVVVWCVTGIMVCQQNYQDYFDWLPRNQFITYYSERVNRYVQKALYDLMMNPDYDRYKDYDSLDECTLTRSNKHVLRFAIRQRFYGSGLLYDYFFSIFSTFSDIQLELLIVLHTDLYDGYAEYLFHPDRNSSKSMRSRFVSKAEFLDMFINPDPGVLNINIINHNTGSEIAEGGFVFRQLLTLHVFDSIRESPRLRTDRSFIISYEDLSSPMFVRMFIAKFKELKKIDAL